MHNVVVHCDFIFAVFYNLEISFVDVIYILFTLFRKCFVDIFITNDCHVSANLACSISFCYLWAKLCINFMLYHE